MLAVSGIYSYAAAPLTQSIFTEIINDVKVVSATAQAGTPAMPNALFQSPDRVRTGPASRVELTAADRTITRIGANTVFMFEAEGRSIDLEKGSILFHTPPGQGGGSIKHGGASAAVLGTTIIGAILADGSFKIMVLEGQCLVTLRDGSNLTLNAGQMIVIPPDGNSFGKGTVNFNLQQLVAHLLLVQGFSHALPSSPLIDSAIQQQITDIANGTVGLFAPFNTVTDGLDLTGGTPLFPSPNPNVFINQVQSPVSPTKGSATPP